MEEKHIAITLERFTQTIARDRETKKQNTVYERKNAIRSTIFPSSQETVIEFSREIPYEKQLYENSKNTHQRVPPG